MDTLAPIAPPIAPVSSGGVETVVWLGRTYRIILTAAQAGGRLGLFESDIEPGDGPPPHVHHGEDEAIHVIDGQAEFWLAGERFTRGPGETAFLPRDVPHSVRVVGAAPSRCLAVVTPGGFEGFFAAAAAAVEASPEGPAALDPVAARFWIEFLGPPPWPAG